MHRLRHRRLFAVISAITIGAACTYATTPASAQDTTVVPQRQLPAAVRPVFPDEFSDLDEGAQPGVAGEWDEVVVDKIEIARKRYLAALSAIESKDTVKAAKLFERALDMLNDLASFPRIEENADFAELAQTIIEDYENYIKSIDALDENSSIFILRDKVFEQVDAPTTAGLVPTSVLPAGVSIPATSIPLSINPFVEKNISFMAMDKGRKFFRVWLERGGRWMDMLRRIAREESMPEEIVHLAMMESALNPNAVSRAKAVGMWQFMAPTGREYDLDITVWKDERRDPEKATRSAMRFLKDLYNDLGDWHLALAAYNCGAGGVRRAIRKSGLSKPTFWEIRDHLPRETRNYVPLYIATSVITMNRKAYGFPDDSLRLHEVFDYDTYVVKEPCNLTALAKCANISLDSIKALNPELIRHCTPPGEPYTLKIPRGSLAPFGERYALLSAEEKLPWLTHTVERGETLAAIAARYGVTAGEIAGINGISGYKARLKRGTSLRIPIVSSAPADRSQAGLAVQRERSSSTPEPRITTKATNASAPETSASNRLRHVVRPGENLHGIAKRYGVRITDLRLWNDIPASSDNLRVGDSLVVNVTDAAIPPISQQNVERLPVRRTTAHTVRRGETLASIAERYGSTTERLRELNDIPRNGAIRAGETLTIETGNAATSERIQRTEQPATAAVRSTSHTVRSGETLGSIAAKYGVSVANLQAWNPKVRPSNMRVGTALTINGSAATAATPAKAPRTYKVRRGDTLAEIADRFGMTVDAIRAKNKSLRRSTTLQAGQVIRLQ